MCKTTPPVYFNINNLRKTSETWARDRAGLPSDRLHQHHGPHLPLRTAGAAGGHGGHPPHHLSGRPPSPTGQHRQRSDGQTDRLSANDSSITRPEGQKMQKFHRAIPLTLRLTEPQLEVSSHLKYGSLLQDIERHLTKEEENLGILSLMWRPTMKREIAVRFQYAVLSWRPSENKIKWPVAGSDVITEEERRRKFKYSLVDSPIERPHNGKFH